MRPVNLIPPDQREGDAAPLRAGVTSYVVVGVLAVALFAVVGVVLTGNSVDEKKAELASLQSRQDQAQQRASQLTPYTEFASSSQERQQVVSDLAKSRFDWQRVLREMALVTPKGISLESLTGLVAPGVTIEGGADPATDASIVGPSLHVIGCGRDQNTVARFIASLKDIDGVTRVGIQSSDLGDASSGGGGAGTDQAATTCQVKPSIAKFDVTVAFDAVPASLYTPGTETATASAATTVAPTSTSSETTTDAGTSTTTPAATSTAAPATAADPGTSAAQAEQKSANDSAATQTNKAKNGAANVGIGK